MLSQCSIKRYYIHVSLNVYSQTATMLRKICLLAFVLALAAVISSGAEDVPKEITRTYVGLAIIPVAYFPRRTLILETPPMCYVSSPPGVGAHVE